MDCRCRPFDNTSDNLCFSDPLYPTSHENTLLCRHLRTELGALAFSLVSREIELRREQINLISLL